MIGRPELTADPRFAGNRERTDNADALDVIVEEWTLTIDGARSTFSPAPRGNQSRRARNRRGYASGAQRWL